MRVLALQHHPGDWTGTLGDFLRSRGAEVMLAKVYQDPTLPQDGFDAVVSTGGTMSAYDIENHPYLAVETGYLARWAAQGVPVLGLCLGGQLLAKALGGEVTESPVREVGWRCLSLTRQGVLDPLFSGVEKSFTALEFHGDVFSLPDGAAHLAQGEDCPNQAFRLKRAYGLQFHPEVTTGLLDEWCETEEERAVTLGRWDEHKQEAALLAQRLFANFRSLAA